MNAIGIVTMRKTITTKRYLSTTCKIYKTIYLFDLSDNRKIMSKILELIGLILIGIMILSFVGAIDPNNAGLSPLFWGCAGGALLIIIYRKRKRKKQEKES
jgi:FtsH-binding integral membrane protein